MSWFRMLKWGGVSGNDILSASVICSGPLLTSSHINFSLKNEITENSAVLVISIFLHGKNSYTSLYFSISGIESIEWLVMGASTPMSCLPRDLMNLIKLCQLAFAASGFEPVTGHHPSQHSAIKSGPSIPWGWSSCIWAPKALQCTRRPWCKFS